MIITVKLVIQNTLKAARLNNAGKHSPHVEGAGKQFTVLTLVNREKANTCVRPFHTNHTAGSQTLIGRGCRLIGSL